LVCQIWLAWLTPMVLTPQTRIARRWT